jgi:hypothetical protein
LGTDCQAIIEANEDQAKEHYQEMGEEDRQEKEPSSDEDDLSEMDTSLRKETAAADELKPLKPLEPLEPLEPSEPLEPLESVKPAASPNKKNKLKEQSYQQVLSRRQAFQDAAYLEPPETLSQAWTRALRGPVHLPLVFAPDIFPANCSLKAIRSLPLAGANTELRVIQDAMDYLGMNWVRQLGLMTQRQEEKLLEDVSACFPVAFQETLQYNFSCIVKRVQNASKQK